MDRHFVNVLMLGFGFMFLFTAFQTMGNIEKTVLDSIAVDNPEFLGDGYTSLAVIYAVLAISNWLAPSVLSISGPRGAMLVGSTTYCLFMVSFLWPQTWLLYIASALLGAGAALTWTGQGTYLSKCSNSKNISRNSGIFWAMLQMSMFFGNLFVYYQFQGKTHIDHYTRQVVFSALIAMAVVGVVFLGSLRHTDPIVIVDKLKKEKTNNNIDADIDSDNYIETKDSITGAFKNAIKLFLTTDMLLLSVTFIYTGLELSFFSGVYSSSIGFTLSIGPSAKQLVGLSGICIGIGEVSGGILFGLLGSKTNKLLLKGRDGIVIIGFCFHLISFLLIFINLPDRAPFGDTMDVSLLDPPLASVALICSLLLGFGDACLNTQIYSMLGGVFARHSAAAFAIFKFTQSMAAAASFVYSSLIGLGLQMGILTVIGVFGTICFCLVEWSHRKTDIKITDDTDAKLNTEILN